MITDHPINEIQWVIIEDIAPNDYNPNSVASKELRLLYISIKQDGFTQPIVTIWDDEARKYIIVDGFHRYFVAKQNADIRESTEGKLPIVVIDKAIGDRMAATVRHNRARGSHSINGMSNMVFSLLNEGWQDHDICNHLGMEPEELLRLKHITGFSRLFADTEYRNAWVTRSQILEKKRYEDENQSETN